MEECYRCLGNLILCPSDYQDGDDYWICEECESMYMYEEGEDA